MQRRRPKSLRNWFRDGIRFFLDRDPSHFRVFPDFLRECALTASDQSIMNAANPSEETKARFAELARAYEPKFPRKFAQMMPFKPWIEELRAKHASNDTVRELLSLPFSWAFLSAHLRGPLRAI
jgi:hypothetical protein